MKAYRLFAISVVVSAALSAQISLGASKKYVDQPSSMMDNLEVMNFRAGGLAAQQSSTTSFVDQVTGGSGDDNRSTYTGEASWVPTWWWNAQTGVKLSIGATGLKSAVTGNSFFVADYQLLLSYDFLPKWALEGGGGGQTWFSNGGTHPMATGNLSYLVSDSFINEIYAGYSRYFLSGNGTNEYHVGIGFRL